jgi:hypothetical protein
MRYKIIVYHLVRVTPAGNPYLEINSIQDLRSIVNERNHLKAVLWKFLELHYMLQEVSFLQPFFSSLLVTVSTLSSGPIGKKPCINGSTSHAGQCLLQ